MKKALILITLFANFSGAIAQRSAYIPFPTAMVSYGYINHCGSDYCYYSAHRMEIQGDTLFNGIHYSKYYHGEKSGDPSNQYPPGGAKGFEKVVGGIRNDIANKKVYLYSIATHTEKLLYDFNLHVGDTLFKNEGYGFYSSLLSASTPGQNPGQTIDTAWVSRIDSVLMPHDGIYHKRFNFKARVKGGNNKHYLLNSDSVSKTPGPLCFKINPLIEGFGPLYNPVSLSCEFEYLWDLSPFCVSVDGKTVYRYANSVPPPFLSFTLCNSIVTGIDEENESPVATIYPNPSNGMFNVVIAHSGKGRLEIFDVFGSTVFKSVLENESTEINLSAISPGIYVARICNAERKTVTKKMIIN